MEGYKVHLLDRWFSLRRLTVPAIVGTFSITSPTTKQRWMLAKDSYEFEGIRVTPTDLTRAYLEEKYGSKKRRITTEQYRNFYDDRRNAPLYAEPCEIPEAVYIDIKSAYWSILQAVSWDVDYMPGAWVSKKSDHLDFPFSDIKMARNCLVSVAANETGAMKIWTGTDLILKKSGNAFVNRMLWSLVMDVLNGIADECIQAGAVYAYTDGFICKASLATTLTSIISSWGLVSVIKHQGMAHIRGAGSYKCGERETGKYRMSRGGAFDRVDRTVNVPFLKKRLKYYSDRSHKPVFVYGV